MAFKGVESAAKGARLSVALARRGNREYPRRTDDDFRKEGITFIASLH
jgi:hypothetical protein